MSLTTSVLALAAIVATELQKIYFSSLICFSGFICFIIPCAMEKEDRAFRHFTLDLFRGLGMLFPLEAAY